jgi:hypothetical protein
LLCLLQNPQHVSFSQSSSLASSASSCKDDAKVQNSATRYTFFSPAIYFPFPIPSARVISACGTSQQ